MTVNTRHIDSIESEKNDIEIKVKLWLFLTSTSTFELLTTAKKQIVMCDTIDSHYVECWWRKFEIA